jgi:D-alanine-D-alanine ligase
MRGDLPDFFDAAYRRVLAPFFTDAQTRREVAAVRELAALSQNDAIIDLGCGWGRHLQHLHRAGHDVLGLDLSMALLSGSRGARGVGADPARDAPVVCGDLQRLPIRAESFDAALNLNTSLGLFLDDVTATSALAEARRILRPGGLILLEGMHRDEVVARFATRDRWRLDDGTEVRARRRFDPATGISEEVLRWRTPDGSVEEKRHRLRLRTGTELIGLVERAGLRVRSAWGDWDGAPFRRLSPRLILRASR